MKGYFYLKNIFLITLYILLLLGSNAFAEGATCQNCGNKCPTYAPYWVSVCPSSERCLEFKNSCSKTIDLSYSIGCDKFGNPGAPECNCTQGPRIPAGQSIYWWIVDANDSSICCPEANPPCLTTGLAVVANYEEDGWTCTKGTRVEFTAGNLGDPYARYDSYNIDVEKNNKSGEYWYSLPVIFKPDINCMDWTYCPRDCNCPPSGKSDPCWSCCLDCRSLLCNDSGCAMGNCSNCDAYVTATKGGCSDGRSPQGNCQDTFNSHSGFTVEYCPAASQSCQFTTRCPSLGDYVWKDLNGNNIQDPDDAGCPGARVNLYAIDPAGSNESFVNTTSTDAEGHYEFANLNAGRYILEFVLPKGYVFVKPNQSADPAKDSDADPRTGRTEIISLSNEQADLTWDAGLIPIKKPKTSINKQTIQVGDQSVLAIRGSTENIVNIITKKIN